LIYSTELSHRQHILQISCGYADINDKSRQIPLKICTVFTVLFSTNRSTTEQSTQPSWSGRRVSTPHPTPSRSYRRIGLDWAMFYVPTNTV